MSDHFGTLCIKGLKLFQERCLKPALDQQINLIRLIRLVFCIRFVWQTVTHSFFEGYNLSSMFFFTPLLSPPPRPPLLKHFQPLFQTSNPPPVNFFCNSTSPPHFALLIQLKSERNNLFLYALVIIFIHFSS